MISLRQAKQYFTPGECPDDKELEETLAFFYFLGEQAYEQVRKERRKAGEDKC